MQYKPAAWFLSHVFPEGLLKTPEDARATGTLRLASRNQCLDTRLKLQPGNAPVLGTCHNGLAQRFLFLRNSFMPLQQLEVCLTAGQDKVPGFVGCDGGFHQPPRVTWHLKEGRLQLADPDGPYCLVVQHNTTLVVVPCSDNSQVALYTWEWQSLR
jgi:hypothetical protein